MTTKKVAQQCSVENCSNKRHYRLFCNTHYHKLYRGSDYVHKRNNPIARFLLSVDKNGPTQPHMDTACWMWTGSKMSRGYGQIYVDGRRIGAHRYSYFIEHGAYPPCVNPAHLYDGSPAQNAKDKVDRGRCRNGSTKTLLTRQTE